MINVAYRNARNGARTLPMGNMSADRLQLIVPNLHRRYSGVTATNRMVAPKLARLFGAAWISGAVEIAAPPRALDLARAAQQRDDRGRTAAIARLAAETGVHLRGPAAPHLDHAVADRPDGRDHRDQRHLGLVPQAPGNRHSPWRRYRAIRAPGRSRGGV